MRSPARPLGSCTPLALLCSWLTVGMPVCMRAVLCVGEEAEGLVTARPAELQGRSRGPRRAVCSTHAGDGLGPTVSPQGPPQNPLMRSCIEHIWFLFWFDLVFFL